MSSKPAGETRPVVRRSRRVPLRIPVQVSHHGEGKFNETTATLAVNANGGLVTLATRIKVGTTVLLRNTMTQEEEECRVVYVGPPMEGKPRVGIAFCRPAPKFWKLDFPPVIASP